MKKITYLTLFIIVFFNQISIAQSINNWQIKKESEVSKTRLKLDKKTIPSKFKVVSLDFKSLQTNLKSASKRSQNNKLASTLLLDFPNEDGTMESFSIEKASVLAPELEAKYPEIQSYYGVSNKNPLNKIYISTSPEGFTGLITGDKTIYIDPASKNDVSNYIVYDRTDCTRNSDDAFACNAIMDEALSNSKTSSNAKTSSTTDGNLRTYRLALACTSAYSLYYGNTIAKVLAAMNTTITRVNSVYRRDLSVIFQIVGNNDRLIYINGLNIDASPDPDPYDNYDGSQMLGANTANITGLITVGAYDIGHVFSTGGGGIAATAPCNATGKGQGVTGIVTPQFDPFDIDYVCHEIGHQFGAGHTQNNNCQRAASAAMEPGSGSTIMGYAGICAPNIQGNSDAYFHAISIQQMTTTCVSGISSGNAAPVITTPVITPLTNYTIPKSTPFILNGSATDANGDAMTYTWEEMDNGTSSGTMPPVSTSTNRPTFRSFFPTSSPSRTFPNLAAIISNTTPTWEVLPSVARTLNFRLTVRDNNSLGGRTSSADCTVTTSSTIGPFQVSSPNTGSEIWYIGETKAITWSTGTSTLSANVNIKLSTDGGYTYPITLATGVANNGTANITIPDNVGKLNRIKVEAAANIFFDISNANFEIKSGKFEMTSAASTQSVCKPTSAVYTINYTPAPSFSETTTFSAVGAPAGSTITFSPTTRSTSGTFTMTVSNTNGIAAGNYPITIKATSTTANIDFSVLLNVFDNTIGNVTLSSPSNGATNQQTSSLLQWNALTSASSYLVQISTSPTFATITESATVTGTSYQTTLLAQGSINYWRVKPINSCTSGSFSEVYVFQVANDLCKTYNNVTFEPNAVWEIGTTNAVSAKINVPDNIVISKVSFYMKATHSSVYDLKMQFSGPTGIFAEVYNRDCATGSNFDVTFDDAGSAITCGSNPGLGGKQQASQSLSKFNGSSSLGTWTLLATDRVPATSGGTFTNFTITICGKLQIVNNITVANNSLSLNKGATATLSQTKLEATQPTAAATQLVYVVTQLPTNGTLKLNNIAMVVGETFTQADINNNLISYTNSGVNANPDSFKFSINGINLALLGGQTYSITVCGAPVPNIASLPDSTGQCAVTVTAPTATSNCYGPITGTTATSFPITAPGTTVVTWTYNDGNGQTSTQNQNVIIGSTTWNGLAWSNGTPTSSTAAIFSGNYSVAANITACTLTVNNNAIVTIPSGFNVTLNGALTVNSGSFTLNNNANLIQSSNVTNFGNITINRNSSALLRLDYTLWSSPVTNTGLYLQAFSPATSTNRFYNYSVSTNLYTAIASPSTTYFSKGQGYLIRMPNDASATVRTNYPGVFIGVPNNGIIPITLTNAGAGKRFNLIGNPYPSPISMTQFVADNSANITGTLYFWRKTNNIGSPTYCTWAGGTFISNGESQVVNPNGIIQTGQGFFIEALNSATSLSFNNGQRAANNTNQFFKTKAIERNTIWLNATNTTGNFSQMAVGYITDATLGIDEFDGKYYNDGAIALNSFLDNTEYVIQGRPLPFDGTDEVPLSFKTTNSGNYTIAIDHVDGLFSGNQDIILKDNTTGTETDLKTKGYAFSATAGVDNTRFSLKYQKTLGINTPVFDEKNVIAYTKNGKIHIKSNGLPLDNVKLFDIRGRLLFEKTKINSNETSIESSKYANQVLIVRIIATDKRVVNKKIVN
ncbi:MAG: T9SS sorting signal type C domain-containing protein [Flavobacterium sp.]|nr:T9SS sorting signal type C domain-containing protein [Flavobacterium sp.]